MSNYPLRIAVSALTDKVYAGRIHDNGIEWKGHKTDVTEDFKRCIVHYATKEPEFEVDGMTFKATCERIDASDPPDTGSISDGYHTFDELYYHRMVLFSIICKQNAGSAWKSLLHDDGTMYTDYFIAGIETPAGSYTYHYHIGHWDRFDVKELTRAPKWDGHLPRDITRLYSLLEGLDANT